MPLVLDAAHSGTLSGGTCSAHGVDVQRHARPEESAPRVHPPRFVTGGEVSWVEYDEEGNELTPAEVRRRAEEQGAEALRRQDALRDLRR